ncbi:MAG: site-specific integrase [Bacteroidales bacterium]|jgi:site-specific recombinase XerD
MKRATFTVLFYIKRTKTLKNGTAPILARITVNRQRAEFSLQKSIEAENWDNHKGCIKGFTKQSRDLNSYLDFVKMKLFEHKREIEEQNKILTATELKNSYLGIEEKTRTILQVFAEHNEKCRQLVNKDFAEGTVERYFTCYKHLKEFIRRKYSRDDMLLHEITPLFINDFEFYLKTTRDCNHNTTTKYIKNFKKIVRIALANGWLKADPFKNIKFHLDDVDMAYLSEDELNNVIQKEFRIERLQNVKDIYLFCCFTGLSFVDVSNLTESDIIKEKDGHYWIKKKRQKTKNWCHIPLLPMAMQILDKYKNYPKCIERNKVLPVLTNQRMNSYLKEIADVCGINKKLSMHTARHTFATTVTLSNQVSMEVVSKMLGHSSINMTKKYARVVDELINKDMQKIFAKYDNNIAV